MTGTTSNRDLLPMKASSRRMVIVLAHTSLLLNIRHRGFSKVVHRFVVEMTRVSRDSIPKDERDVLCSSR